MFLLPRPAGLLIEIVRKKTMPRSARKKSNSNIYHIMLRGVNRQEIFADAQDCRKFLSILKDCKSISGFEVFAYCLMSNHIHLLIRAGVEPPDLIIKRIGSRFVYWYNLKYCRVGHLFQDRFKSETIENELSFLAALRYIIQNPMKAGIEREPGTYPWSSFASYGGIPDQLTDTAVAMSFFPAREALLEFLTQEHSDPGLEDVPVPIRMPDEKAKEIMGDLTGCHSAAAFQNLDRKIQKDFAAELRKKNLSIGQIARLTGMSKTTIFRASGGKQKSRNHELG